MAAENMGPQLVTFASGYDVWIMAIDGTWRRSCVLRAISTVDAKLTFDGSIEELNLKEFFLLLSSSGLAYRRCELVRVNGADMEIRFLMTKNKVKKSPKQSKHDDPVDA
jgi:hypothetical protein